MKKSIKTQPEYDEERENEEEKREEGKGMRGKRGMRIEIRIGPAESTENRAHKLSSMLQKAMKKGKKR